MHHTKCITVLYFHNYIVLLLLEITGNRGQVNYSQLHVHSEPEKKRGSLFLCITLANLNRFLGHRLGDDLVDWNSGVSVRPSVRPQKVFPISI